MALLAVDVGMQTVIVLFHGPQIVERWRVATQRTPTADDLAATLQGAAAARARPLAGRGGRDLVDRAGARPCRAEPSEQWLGPYRVAGVEHGHARADRQPGRGGPDRHPRQLWVVALRARRRPHRGRLSHLDELRRGVGERRVPGRVSAPGVEISMEALFGRAARLFKVVPQRRHGDRPQHRRGAAERRRLRLRGPGRRDRRSDAPSSAARRRRSRPAASPA